MPGLTAEGGPSVGAAASSEPGALPGAAGGVASCCAAPCAPGAGGPRAALATPGATGGRSPPGASGAARGGACWLGGFLRLFLLLAPEAAVAPSFLVTDRGRTHATQVSYAIQ